MFRPLVPQKQIRIVDDADGSGGLESAFDSAAGDEANNAPTAEVVLNAQEAKIYKLVDGKRSVATIME